MADQDGRSVLPVQHARRGRDVVLERRQRVLDDRDAEAAPGQVVVHPAPAGAVGERPVDEDDVGDSLLDAHVLLSLIRVCLGR